MKKKIGAILMQRSRMGWRMFPIFPFLDLRIRLTKTYVYTYIKLMFKIEWEKKALKQLSQLPLNDRKSINESVKKIVKMA
jgi:hypothetical protein